jgi:hypothetical protein
MLIAQHSVAGEVVTRLDVPQESIEVDDQSALVQYACDQTNLPWLIFRAVHRANQISSLPARARCVLAALARTVDAARPYAAIFARRELLTGRAMQSMRTFYRSLDDLVDAGFIIRQPQARYGGAGLFGRAYLNLTPKAACLLGLATDADADADAARIKPAEQREHAYHDTKVISFDHPCVTVADGAIYKDLSPNSQKRQPGHVPVDLQRLRILGFRDFLIFKLMREARLSAKRLSDVVEASWEHLRRATHPISYLRALLRAPVDFAYRVHDRRSKAEEQTSRKTLSEENRAAADEFAGRRFVSHDGLRQYAVSEDGVSVTVAHRHEARPRVHAGAWIHDFVSALRAGHIRPIADCASTPPSPVREREAIRSPILHTSEPTRLDALKRVLRARHGMEPLRIGTGNRR